MGTDVTFEAYKEEWLADICTDNPSTLELGQRFARKLLTQWLDIDDTSDDLVYCDGAGDGGIDIAYLYRGEGSEGDGVIEGHTWYLVQSKYGSAFRGTNTLLEESHKVIETLDGHRKRLSSLAEGLLERLTTFRHQASELDRIMLVFATEEPLNEEQKRTLNDIRSVGRERLGTIFDVEVVSIATIHQRTLEEIITTAQARLEVPIKANVPLSGKDLLVGSVSLLSLYDFLKNYRAQTGDLDRLYEKNVRRFLGTRGRVNKAIQQTLKEAPERFGLYNNGITIVVTDFNQHKDETLELIEPYVVNGCQTTRTIWEGCHQRLEAGGTGADPEMESWRQKACQGAVITKIVKVGVAGEDLLQAITRYTNSQNAVREKEFLSLNSGFKTWAKQRAEKHGVFLEIQRGGWDSQRALQRQNPNITQFDQHANAFDLLKVYGAGWLGEAGTAFGRNAAFSPNGTIFRRITSNEDGDEPFGTDDLYVAYRLQKSADNYQFGRVATKTSRRLTRFLFYMIVLEILKDVMIRADMKTVPKNFTRALLKLFEQGNEQAIEALLTTAIEVVDEYLTQGAEESVFAEPVFQNTFNSNLNTYLKWEQMGKTDQASPRLRSLLAVTKRTMNRKVSGQQSPRELITAAIKV
jgi:hypothetical protein